MQVSWIDWLVLLSTISSIVIYGVWKTRSSLTMTDFIKGGEQSGWFSVGLSVMATQASAITFMSTPGQAFHDGMGFVQFYFGLPLAMVVICLFFLPRYKSLNVYTAYEYLENRFDYKTRAFTSTLFLVQRGLGAGITIFAPAIILSTILGWSLNQTNIIIGITVIIYTLTGGAKAVSVTHKQQMAVMMLGMVLAFVMILWKLPEGINLVRAYEIATASDKTKIINYSFDLQDRYTIWSGLTGGFFLSLAYFGTDHSQVQRYISAKDEKQSRLGLIMNGLLKVPLQFFILFVGLMVFVFYQFNKAPLFFNPVVVDELSKSQGADTLKLIESKYEAIFDRKSEVLNAAQLDDQKLREIQGEEKQLRNEVKSLISNHLPERESNDKDYVFINFVLTHLPKGVVGLLLAMILCAAMSSTSSEISSLASSTTMDIYQPLFAKSKSESHLLSASKIFTLSWGIIAIGFACVASLFENLIQFVNIVGSLFYGTMLGVFLVGFFIDKVKGNAVFLAAIIAELSVILIYKNFNIGYLWLNLIGSGLVIVISLILSYLSKIISTKQLT
jgi:solute:Na+ symporter, SSS family